MTPMTLENLRTSVAGSRVLVALIIGATALAYALMFAGVSWSNDPAAWGQFGDYIGGLLNPLVAVFAFYWLTQSIILQLSELNATTKALAENSQAQQKHERHAEKTATINALSAILTCHNTDISNLRSNIEFITSQLHGIRSVTAHDGRTILHEEALRLVAEMRSGLESSLLKRLAIMERIEALMAANVAQQQVPADVPVAPLGR